MIPKQHTADRIFPQINPCLLSPCEGIDFYTFLHIHGNVYQRIFTVYIYRVRRFNRIVFQIPQAVQFQLCLHTIRFFFIKSIHQYAAIFITTEQCPEQDGITIKEHRNLCRNRYILWENHVTAAARAFLSTATHGEQDSQQQGSRN